MVGASHVITATKRPGMRVRPNLSASRMYLEHGLASPQKQTCDIRLLNPLGCSWQCAEDRSVSSLSTSLALAVHAQACTATARAWLHSSSRKGARTRTPSKVAIGTALFPSKEDDWFHCACLCSRWGYTLETLQEFRGILLPPKTGHVRWAGEVRQII
jgi:hypothetical protein